MSSRESKGAKALKQTGSVALVFLKAVGAGSDAFPPLKGAANCAVYIAEVVVRFKTNKSDWLAFGRHVEESVAILLDALPDASCSLDTLNDSIEKLRRALESVQQDIKRMQSGNTFGRFMKFTREPDKIKEMRQIFDDSVTRFQLQTSIRNTKTLHEINVNAQSLDKIISAVTGKAVGAIKLHDAINYLPYADGASYSSVSGCMQGTRSDLLSRIHAWVDSGKERLSKPEVLWLEAVAGAGKSAVAHSVAKLADDIGLLASSFFFQHGIESRSSPNIMLSTIIRDLAGQNQLFGDSIGATLDAKRSLASADVQRQFEELMIPYARYLPREKPIFIVIDGLDEASDKSALQQFLNILRSQITDLPGNFRILVTSRQIDSIRHALSTNLSHIQHKKIDTQSSSNRDDLTIFVKSSLLQISKDRSLENWPESNVIGRLVSKAEGLFIWASVVINLLKFETINATDTLLDILENIHTGLSPEIKMDETYAKTLEVCGKWGDQYYCQGYVAVIGAIVTVQYPLSILAMQSLFRHDFRLNKTFLVVVQSLSPLLIGVDMAKMDAPIRAIHLSFKTFITGQSQSGLLQDRYRVLPQHQNEQLAFCCLQVLNEDLDESTPGVKLEEDKQIASFDLSKFPEALLYAFKHWKSHWLETEDSASSRLDHAIGKYFAGPYHEWVEYEAWKEPQTLILDSGRIQGKDGVGLAELFRNFLRLATCLEKANRLGEALLATEVAERAFLLIAVARPAFEYDLAMALQKKSLRLTRLNRHKEALVAIKQAVYSFRSYDPMKPDRISSGLILMPQDYDTADPPSEEPLEIYHPLVRPLPAAINEDHAHSLCTLSDCFAILGHYEAGLMAVKDSVDILRSLKTPQSDLDATSSLGKSLSILSRRLSDLERFDEVKEVEAESVENCRILAAARPEDYTISLAKSLGNLSNTWSKLGHNHEALHAAKETVDIFRSLVFTHLNDYDIGLAKSLYNLSMRLADMEHHEEALVAIEEGIRLLRSHKASQSDSFFQAEDLASFLNQLARCYSVLGRHENALRSAKEEADIHELFTSAKPDYAFSPALGKAFYNLASRYITLGRRDRALATIEKVIDLGRKAAFENPTSFETSLIQSLDLFSHLLEDMGFNEEAWKVAKEAVDIRRPLAIAQSDDVILDLAISLNSLSIRSVKLGYLKDALKASEESVEIRRSLATENPERFEPGLAGSLHNLAIFLSNLGLREEALKTVKERTEICRSMANKRPEEVNPELAESLDDLSSRAADLGLHEEALKAIEDAIEVHRLLVAAQGDIRKVDLAESLYQSSARYLQLGMQEESLKAVRESVQIRRVLATTQPDKFIKIVIYTFTLIPLHLRELGRPEEAISAFEEAIEFHRSLPETQLFECKPQLALLFSYLSRHLNGLGRKAEALKPAEEAVDVHRQLAAANTNFSKQEFAEALQYLSGLLQDLERKDEADSMRQEFESLTL